MSQFNFSEIEKKWQSFWAKNQVFKAEEGSSKPKYYVLDMFPYPSGAGLHVGHPLGYIASDIVTRFKRMRGFNVLHPMGYDAFGLPAEQYAIKTGQHPAVTTEQNISVYRKQLDALGLSFDWSREVRTSDPKYYKHTQWVFIQLFNSWYDEELNRARDIESLIRLFEEQGNQTVQATHSCQRTFTADGWAALNDKEKENVLQDYRLAYQAETLVNWCAELGTVLANDEVKEGYSVRGNHPVEQKKMMQWSLRISAYAERLLRGLDHLEWPDSLKEMQRNWIGRSEGAEVLFKVVDRDVSFPIYTTRPDTLFGCTFMVLAPESDLVEQVVSDDQKQAVLDYIEMTKKRTERERLADNKRVSGVFTGSYCAHPFTDENIPIWISEYVLGGYGTGAIMAVPAHDDRDYRFAKYFNLPIVPVIEGSEIADSSYDAKSGKMMNSEFINGLEVKEAIAKMIDVLEEKNLGVRKVNFRLRDAIFSRQRYWGEPFPVYFTKDGIPKVLKESELPLELPEVDAYLPTAEGEPPLARAKTWQTASGEPLETSTMPGFAGSSAYFLRYMDPQNEDELVSETSNHYWRDVDLYVGGAEHATGHLLYSRFWNMFLFDLDYICEEEPFKKLINQGMIQGRSNFVYRLKDKPNTYVSKGLTKQHGGEYETLELHVDVNIVSNDILDTDAFKKWSPENKDAEFILEDGKYHCGHALEKMSKSLYNVVNPDDVIQKYGADTLRLYEMFLGPVEHSKPWNTNGIEGTFRFLSKLWRSVFDDDGSVKLVKDKPTLEEQKIIHTLVKKITHDIEAFALNTAVSAFMIALNDLSKVKSKNLEVFEKFILCLGPFAPHISEEIWNQLGHKTHLSQESFPNFDESFLVENTFNYPVSINGKMKFLLEIDKGLGKDEVEKLVLENEQTKKLLGDKKLKKVIVVPNKIVNLVV